ncbi:hypothetical protein [Aquirufa sp. 5-AUSEE-100C1]
MQKLAREKNETLSPKSQFAFPAFICLVSLCCLAYYFVGSPSPLILQEVSEIIPDRAIVDSNGTGQLESTVYFIRQSFVATPHFNNSITYGAYLINMSFVLILLLIGFKQWGQFSYRYLFGGFLSWAFVIYFTNSNASLADISLILIDQLTSLGILTLVLTTVFISASIPRILFQFGQTETPKQSKKNWLFFSSFYLANLILSYGNSYLAWDIPLAIPGLVFFVAAWSAYSFLPNFFNKPLVWGLGMASLGTVLLLLISGNDAGIQAFQHWTLICFILMLLLFPLFIYSNFRTPLSQNLPVYKIVHKAPHIDLRIIYIGVTILGIAWVFAKNGTVWHQLQAAYYNERGDIALLRRDKQGTEFAYQRAMIHSKLNAKSNLSLAAMALDVQDVETAAYYLTTANVKHPKPAQYIALAAIYQQANKSFEALFALQQGQQKFPESLEMNTQLARQFENLQSADSAKHYYERAWRMKPSHPIALANYLYASKELQSALENQDDPAVQANQVAISMLKGNKFTEPKSVYDTSPGGDLRVWALIYNYNLWAKDQAALIPSDWMKNPSVLATFPEIKLLDAWQEFHHGKCLKALQKVNLLISADTTSKTEGLQQILGFWKQSLLEPQTSPRIENWQQAQVALDKYPFQIEVLQKSLALLNQAKKEKEGYDAALAALQWNENIPVYYLIYAIQAYHIGEITYGNEALEALKKLSPSTYEANKTTLSEAQALATERQKFN